jgi:hypothetical protein
MFRRQIWRRNGEYYSFLNDFGTVACVPPPRLGRGMAPGADAGTVMRLDIIANRDHIANGSGRSKRGSATKR